MFVSRVTAFSVPRNRRGAKRVPRAAKVAVALASCIGVALADARDDGLPGEPHLVFAAREIALLPRRRRHYAAPLAGDVETRRCTEPERGEPIRDVLNAHRDGELVEVHVARTHDCNMQVDGSVDAAAAFSIAMRLAGKAPFAWTVDLVIGGYGLVLQRRQRNERLDRRARRIDAGKRAIVERLVDVGRERVVVGLAQALGKAVRIE
jgi:hypothetical protein